LIATSICRLHISLSLYLILGIADDWRDLSLSHKLKLWLLKTEKKFSVRLMERNSLSYTMNGVISNYVLNAMNKRLSTYKTLNKFILHMQETLR